MSTLADLSLNPQTLKGGVYSLFQGDSTLQGSGYLNGTTQIVAQKRAPMAIRQNGKPRIHLIWDAIVPDMYTATGDCLLEVRAAAPNPRGGVVADTGLLGKLLERSGQIVVGTGVMTASGYRFMDSWAESITGIFGDPADPEESYQSLMVRIRARKL